VSDAPPDDLEAFVRRGVDAFNAHDLDAVVELYDPDATAQGPEGWPEADVSDDRDAIRRQYQVLVEPWEDYRVEMLQTEVVGDAALVHLVWHTRGRASELETDFDLWHLYRFRHGRIIRHEFHWSREDARRAAGAADG
jgi:ketosteroid isomerase-like protein